LDTFQVSLCKALNVGIEPKDIRNALLATWQERRDVYHPCPVLKRCFSGFISLKTYLVNSFPFLVVHDESL
jgi:hypothetical protein